MSGYDPAAKAKQEEEEKMKKAEQSIMGSLPAARRKLKKIE